MFSEVSASVAALAATQANGVRCQRRAECHIIALWRDNSAHLHRPWRATLRFCTIPFDLTAVRARSRECRRILVTHQGAPEQNIGFGTLLPSGPNSDLNPNTRSKNDSA